MKSSLKTVSLESRFPLLSVENDCIVSKSGDITAGFAVELPEVFTLTSAEYEALHGTWVKALRVLPDFTVVHKQDFFTEERYTPHIKAEDSVLARAYERHFNERPYLEHSCYLYITMTTRERMRGQSNLSTLCRSNIVPREALDGDAVARFMDAVGQAESILRESGMLRLRRLTSDQIVGTDSTQGVLGQYFTLSRSIVPNGDIRLDPGRMTIGDNILCLHTLSDLDDLPQRVSTDERHEGLSTDRSDCRLSFAAPVGLLLGCNHIYNQFVRQEVV